MTTSLKVMKPESMDPDTVLEWSKNAALAGLERYRDAEAYCNAMQRHYESITQLVSRLQELRAAKAPKNREEAEEIEEIVDTFVEVSDAMEALANERAEDDGAVSLDEEEEQLLGTPSGQEASRQLDTEAKAFLKVYSHHKARLGLDTQVDVANLTGIDRRYISEIERGAHKPQFRTLKKLAAAFGINVTELMGE